MSQVLIENNEMLDPHSAIGVAAGRAKRINSKIPHISLATAHPAKFPDAVKRASGQHPTLPDRLTDLFEREEKFTVLENNLELVQDFIKTHRMDGAS